jgi:hypothetical protein
VQSSTFNQDERANWKSVRLELARSPGFPRGSSSRAFLLRLPLHSDGSIDSAAIDDNKDRAVVRRFWASEPDLAGVILSRDGEWLLHCVRVGASANFLMHDDKLVVDQNILIEGPDAIALPFRVVSVDPIGGSPIRTS